MAGLDCSGLSLQATTAVTATATASGNGAEPAGGCVEAKCSRQMLILSGAKTRATHWAKTAACQSDKAETREAALGAAWPKSCWSWVVLLLRLTLAFFSARRD